MIQTVTGELGLSSDGGGQAGMPLLLPDPVTRVQAPARTPRGR